MEKCCVFFEVRTGFLEYYFNELRLQGVKMYKQIWVLFVLSIIYFVLSTAYVTNRWRSGWSRIKIQWKAVPWFMRLVAGLLQRRPVFDPGSLQLRFVVHKVALRQVYLRVIRCPPVYIIHYDSPHSYITWGMNNRPVGCRNSESSSHPIDMNRTVQSKQCGK
jgi:hypothetical protein